MRGLWWVRRSWWSWRVRWSWWHGYNQIHWSNKERKEKLMKRWENHKNILNWIYTLKWQQNLKFAFQQIRTWLTYELKKIHAMGLTWNCAACKGRCIKGFGISFPESAERKAKVVWSWWGKEAWGRFREEERQKATAEKRVFFHRNTEATIKGASNISRATFLKCQQKIISVMQWFSDQLLNNGHKILLESRDQYILEQITKTKGNATYEGKQAIKELFIIHVTKNQSKECSNPVPVN